MTNVAKVDRAAIGFSLVCILHCTALPALAIALPVFGVLSDTEWVHWLFTLLAIGAALVTALMAPSARIPSFLAPATGGVALLVFALVSEPLGFGETIPTVLGAMLLSGAHLYRLYQK
ncbi:MAG: MerC domain-containing protein [Pseudomonadota bacterium]